MTTVLPIWSHKRHTPNCCSILVSSIIVIATQLIRPLHRIWCVSHVTHEWSITMPLLSIRLSAAIAYSSNHQAFCPKPFFTLSPTPCPACCAINPPPFPPTHTCTGGQKLFRPAVQLVLWRERCPEGDCQIMQESNAYCSVPFLSPRATFKKCVGYTCTHLIQAIIYRSLYHVYKNLDPSLWMDNHCLFYVHHC